MIKILVYRLAENTCPYSKDLKRVERVVTEGNYD